MIARKRINGFTLIEIAIVAAMMSMFLILLYGLMRTTTMVNNDVYIASEIQYLPSQIADTLETRLRLANVEAVPPYVPAPTFTSLSFVQIVMDNLGEPVDGVSLSPKATFDPLRTKLNPDATLGGANWFVRFVWVPTPTKRYSPALLPGEVTEAVLNVDIDNDGLGLVGSNWTETEVYLVGYIEMQFVTDAGGVQSAFTTKLARAGQTHVLVNKSMAPPDGAGAGGDLPPLFSTLANVNVVPVAQTLERSFRMNLTVIHDPILTADGRRSAIYRVSRVVTPY